MSYFKNVAMTSFHAEKCYCTHTVNPAPMQQLLPVPDL